MFQKHTKKKILFLSTKGDNRLNKPKNCDIISNCKAGDSMLEEEREYKIVGYHGTTSSAQESIENYGLDPRRVKIRDDHWLGQGVYFYEDFDLAKWWAETKASKRKHCEYALVYKSDIICPLKHVLNLDDRNDLDIFIRSCLDFIKDLQRAYDKLPDFEIPKFRAIYFDYYKTQHDIHVIVRTFQKDAPKYAGTFRTGEELETQKELLDFLGLSYFETQICVSNADCINEVIKVYDKTELSDETEEVL